MYRLRFLALVGMILAAVASRLIPHPPNFAPIGAMALFGGLALAEKGLPELREAPLVLSK